MQNQRNVNNLKIQVNSAIIPKILTVHFVFILVRAIIIQDEQCSYLTTQSSQYASSYLDSLLQ